MMENGKMTVETAKVFINGQMEINTKENGQMIREMVKVILKQFSNKY